MKRSKNKLNAPGSGPKEADPFNAMDALRAGEELPVGYFLRDLTQAVGILANLFDPPKGAGQRLQFFPRAPQVRVPKKVTLTAIDEEWESTLFQLKRAIHIASTRPIGWFLRDVGTALGLVATALDPPQGARGWRLEFTRQGRGRRPDPKKFQRDLAIATEILVGTWDTGKQDATIAEMQAKHGISRSTIFRAKKKNNKTRKSHKKT